MGAIWFQEIAYGKSLRDAYSNACQDAENYAGHQDGYSGTISSTNGVSDLTDQYKRSKKSFDEYVKMQVDKLNKRDCAGICILEPIINKNKTKSQVEHVVTPGTKKWVLKYEVEEYYGDGKVLASCTQKGEAVKIARAYTEKTENPTIVVMRKLLLGPNLTAKITYKKSTTERPGKYILFGWAAE